MTNENYFVEFQRAKVFAPSTAVPVENLLETLSLVELSVGNELYAQGDVVDAIYLVCSGELMASFKSGEQSVREVDRIPVGETVGEMEVLSGEVRHYSVSALEKTILVKFPKASFDQFLDQSPEIIQPLWNLIQERLWRNYLARALPTVFGQLDADGIEMIEKNTKRVRILRGEYLYHLGDPGGDFYILIDGRVEARVIEENGEVNVVDEIEPGESIGEIEFFSGSQRTTSIYADRDSDLVRISQQNFEQLLLDFPQVMGQLNQILVHRIRELHGTLDKQPATFADDVALLPLHPSLDIKHVAEQIQASLSSLGGTQLISSASVGEHFGSTQVANAEENTPDSIRLNAWLNKMEAEHDYLLYILDSEPSLWNDRCMRLADQIYLMADADQTPEPSNFEAEHIQKNTLNSPVSLVLVHPSDTERPEKTAAWLAVRNLRTHYHIRREHQPDLDRLARFIAGKAIGLVLSGGGMRSAGQIGVVKAMSELGIPIDYIGGTSAGSFISALHSFGFEPPEMVEWQQNSGNANFSFTLPLISLDSGKKFSQKLKKTFGTLCFEDLWIPCFAVSSNLSRASKMVHDTGEVWLGLRASGSLPGFAPPVVLENGDLLIDGALLDNLPIDIMREKVGKGIVIAVDVSPPIDMAENSYLGASISGWKVLWSRINPFQPSLRIPAIAQILQRTSELNSIQDQIELIESDLVDEYLRLPVENFGLLDFKGINDMVEIGYQYAKEKLDTLKPA